jgi:type 1 glutamine amidotransferase
MERNYSALFHVPCPKPAETSALERRLQPALRDRCPQSLPILRCVLWGLALAMTWGAGGAEPFVRNSEELARIEQAIPRQAPARPARGRRLLIFTLNVGYGGHPSIAHANQAFTLMGQKTGAFATVVSADPAVFARQSLKQFDAVFFNNTVGNCFTNRQWQQDLAEFVMGGGGLMGVHGTTVAFTRWPGAIEDWPEFGFLIGARGANHKDSDEHVWIRVEEPDHPLTRVFGGAGFDYRDEFFRVHEPYSRNRLRVLLTIDTAKTDMTQGPPRGDCLRADNDYALAWIGSYGRGRIFYCTMAHNPRDFWDPKLLEFYLAAAQFALGDLPAPTTPSARLSAAVRAQERLGWRLGTAPRAGGKQTLFEAVDQAAQLGLSHLGGASGQPVSREILKELGPRLTESECEAVRLKLAGAGVRLVTYHLPDFPADDAGRREWFEFGRKMGIETFISEPDPQALDRLEQLCDEFDVKLALHDCGAKAAPDYGRPDGIIEACRGRGARIGAAGSLAAWRRTGIDPLRALQALADRLLTVELSDLPGQSGAESTEAFLLEIQRLGLHPTLFALEGAEGGPESLPRLTERIQRFNAASLKAAAAQR